MHEDDTIVCDGKKKFYLSNRPATHTLPDQWDMALEGFRNAPVNPENFDDWYD
jgi:hypothetical protein